jgi:hypothetical protein
MATIFTVRHDDISRVPSDLLLLKHAKWFHGGDLAVANMLTDSGACSAPEISPRPDEFAIIQTRQALAPSRVMFLGTVALRDFSYSQMRNFARRAIEILAEQSLPVKLLTTTVHGVNYGLDASESLQSLVRGFQEGLAQHPSCRLDEIIFVEKQERTARILSSALETMRTSSKTEKTVVPLSETERVEPRPTIKTEARTRPLITNEQISAKDPEPAKKHVFVAMPFSEEFQDIYEFGIYGPIRRCGFICERVDEPSFTGDILQRIIQRISTAEFVVAELTGARANVYLEVGYAWGKNIPVITLAREGEKLQFDLSTHRCVFYKTIGQLAKELEKLVRGVYER